MEPSRRSRSPRQILIGLDAAEWTLVQTWAREGKLPSLARLLACGFHSPFPSVSAQLPDAVWPALITGLNPAKIEKYFYVQYHPQTMGLRHVPNDAIRRTPFWAYLGQAGRQVGVLDPSHFPASRSINGFQLANWGVHPTQGEPAAHPASLAREIESHFGRHPVGDCDAVDESPGSLRQLRRRILEAVRLRGQVIRHLIRERPSDVFFATFSETHCAGHHFWGFLDPSSSRPLTTETLDLADTLEQVYRAVDREVGEILAAAGDDTVCMVFSAHGMGPLRHASWNLPEILDLLGYGRHPASQSRHGRDSRRASVNPWRILRMVMPAPLQYWIKARLPQRLQDELLFRWYAGGRHWKGCRAFAVPNNDSVGAIRISVEGRDRHGMVAPGAAYRQLCREIAEALYELTDVEGGRPVVKQVTFTHDVFKGPFLEGLPDLTVLWEQSRPWTSLCSPRFGTLRLRRQDARSGAHTPHGFVLAMGPGIPAGAEGRDGSIYGIAPTILDLAGVPIPPDLDGTPLFRMPRMETSR